MVLTIAAMLTAACGSESGGDNESGAGGGSDAPSDAAVSDGDTDQEADAGSGQAEATTSLYSVDGASFGGDLYNCDPSDGAGDAEPGDLELVVLSGPSEGLSIDAGHSQGLMRIAVRFNRVTDAVEEFESEFYENADGGWTANAASTLDGPPFTVEGNRIQGEATLLQVAPQDATGTVEVAFDFEIPELSC